MPASLASPAIQTRLACHKADAFNARFARGDAVLYLAQPTHGQPATPEWDRVYSIAFVRDGRAWVHLAGRAEPVDVDGVTAAPVETSHVRAPRRGVDSGRLVLAVVMGFAVAVLLGAAPLARPEPPAHLVIDCAEPGVPAAAADAGRAQA